MKRTQWGPKCLLAGLSAAIFASVAGGCASTQGSSPAALAAPANYRQLVAAKIREMEDVSALQAVEISRPRERFVGLINGGTRPAVCVRVVRPNIFGASAAWYYFFYFENGKADGYKFVPTNLIERAMYPCDDPLTPITPLVRSRR